MVFSYERGTPVAVGMGKSRWMRSVWKGVEPPWRQPRGKSMVSSVNSHTNATRTGWHLREIDFAPGSPPGWVWNGAEGGTHGVLCSR